jgi:hypothetical protein
LGRFSTPVGMYRRPIFRNSFRYAVTISWNLPSIRRREAAAIGVRDDNRSVLARPGLGLGLSASIHSAGSGQRSGRCARPPSEKGTFLCRPIPRCFPYPLRRAGYDGPSVAVAGLFLLRLVLPEAVEFILQAFQFPDQFRPVPDMLGGQLQPVRAVQLAVVADLESCPIGMPA